jgi:hypothetical protein
MTDLELLVRDDRDEREAASCQAKLESLTAALTDPELRLEMTPDQLLLADASTERFRLANLKADAQRLRGDVDGARRTLASEVSLFLGRRP